MSTGFQRAISSTFSNCVDEVKNWMASNCLRLNPDKTELIRLASSRRLDQCPAGQLFVSGAHVKPSMKEFISTLTYRYHLLSVR